MLGKITDKWELQERHCRSCGHLRKLLPGAKNVKGEWMTPEGFWFRIGCAMEGKSATAHDLKRRRGCPFYEVGRSEQA